MLVKHFDVEVQRGMIINNFTSPDTVEEYLRRIDELSTVGGSKRNMNNAQGCSNRSENNRTNSERDISRDTRPTARGNNEGHTVRSLACMGDPDIDLLSNPEDLVQDDEKVSPTISIHIFGMLVEVLIDSGSDICAISEKFYSELSNLGKFPILPVIRGVISVAIGGETQKIKSQILIPVQLEGIDMDVNCLVIPQLNCNLIFGSNWLSKHHARLDYQYSQLKLMIEGVSINTKLSFRIDPQKISINLCEKNDYVFDVVENKASRVTPLVEYSVDDGDSRSKGYSAKDIQAAAAKTTLSGSAKASLLSILEKYRNTFSDTPGRVVNYFHQIELVDENEFNFVAYPVPMVYRDEVRRQIGEMLAAGVIQKERTYISPLVCVKKRDGNIRVCLDARGLNSKMKKDFVNPPNPFELMANFIQGQIMSTIDLTQAYWQIPVLPDHTKYLGFYWPRMQRHVRQVVASCDLCQKAKPSPISKAELHPILVDEPGKLVCIDLIGPLPVGRGGVTQLFVLVDAFTKFVKLYALRRATAKTLLKRLFDDYIPSVQKPVSILSDNGTQFTSHIWRKQLEAVGIQLKFISCYFPQGNPTERYNREVGRMLRTYCYEGHSAWPNKLADIERCLNRAVNLSTGFAPIYLQFGQIDTNPVRNFVVFPERFDVNCTTLKEDTGVAYEKLKRDAAKRVKRAKVMKPVTFDPGDKVLVKTHPHSSAEAKLISKFFLLYDGPYTVLQQAGPNSYVIGHLDGKIRSKENVINLKAYKQPSDVVLE
ncbi:unnamed protein product [Acanthoscelides obtectus]|uniref:RNA-directed DNA polymerase n=1 Tax=Acanthoscelides obtectus TaxID=200917 RepID=A0A9P0PID8_ACAOB|nr:unnamed protein product [Acanthoscelides obtectus]CAK1661171.1 Transposon Tf2-9 polyprotein [Acanthoscelides obtectus]